MKKYVLTFAVAITLIAALQGCFKTGGVIPDALKPVLPVTPYNYKDQSGWSTNFRTTFDNSFLKSSHDLLDDNIVTLGRVLFYDSKLSINNMVSCASCHKQNAAFSDVSALSKGFEGKMTTRNSMPIINSMMVGDLFWDSRAHSTQDLVLKPLQHHVEMGMESMDLLTKKLTKTEYYPDLFAKAYGSTSITENGIQAALAQFVESMITANSKYDQGLDNNFANFNALEKKGYEIFRSAKAKCASCHIEPNFTASSFIQTELKLDPNSQVFFPPFFNGGNVILIDPKIEPGMGGGGFGGYGATSNTTNIGLDVVYADQGRMNGQFKIPSLRNIELTAPYMHDGRFNTLEEVIEHYSKKIQPHAHLDTKFMNNGTVKPLELSEIEKEALIAFLKTLTDNTFIQDKKFSNPFKP